MTKHILLAIAIIFLAKPSIQLKCYECKSAVHNSKYPHIDVSSMEKCSSNKNEWPVRNIDGIKFEKCLKVVKKITDNNKQDDELIIRTIGSQDLKLDDKIFTVYACDQDLCNSGVTLSTNAAFTAVLSLITIIAGYF